MDQERCEKNNTPDCGFVEFFYASNVREERRKDMDTRTVKEKKRGKNTLQIGFSHSLFTIEWGEIFCVESRFDQINMSLFVVCFRYGKNGESWLAENIESSLEAWCCCTGKESSLIVKQFLRSSQLFGNGTSLEHGHASLELFTSSDGNIEIPLSSSQQGKSIPDQLSKLSGCMGIEWTTECHC